MSDEPSNRLEVSTTPAVMGIQAINPGHRPPASGVFVPDVSIPSVGGDSSVVGAYAVFSPGDLKMSEPTRDRQGAINRAMGLRQEGKACVIVQIVAQFKP